MTLPTYQERDGMRVIILKSDDAGVTWYPDVTGGGSGGGSGDIADAVILAPTTSARNVIEGTGDVTPLTLNAEVGQTAPLLLLKDEDGNDLAYLEQAGSEVGGGHLHLGGLASYTLDATARLDGSGIRTVELVGAASGDSSGFAEWLLTLDVRPDGTTEFAQIGVDGTSGFAYIEYTHEYSRIRVRAHTGQTEALIQVFDENGNAVARVLPSGAIGTTAGEPDDADIRTGELFFYFDSTAGTPTIKFKGKDAVDGVFTATIPMTAA